MIASPNILDWAPEDRISANFAVTRRFPWPFVTNWLQERCESQELDKEALDVGLLVAGCGDGRHVLNALELG